MRIVAARALAHVQGCRRRYFNQLLPSGSFDKGSFDKGNIISNDNIHRINSSNKWCCYNPAVDRSFSMYFLCLRYLHNSKPSNHEATMDPKTTIASTGRSNNSHLFNHLYRPFQVLFRAAVVMAEITMLSIWRFVEKDINKRAEKLRRSLIRLGPFYIKLGQALSTRADILPQEYCYELAKLQDRIPPFSTAKALKYVESELGSPTWKLFAEITEEPVAAASLGQVYKARLHSGELVAVKVQRPGIPSRLALDAQLLHLVGGQLKRFAGARGDLIAVVDQMVVHMYEEIDYLQEGKNAERFYDLYGLSQEELSERECALKEGKREKHGEASKHQRLGSEKIMRQHAKREGLVKVPRIYWEFTTRGILTMEWIDGIKLTDKEALAKLNLDTQELVDQGVFCSLRQLLEDGFFHADPHPGNFVVTKEGVLAYFDFGMMGNFPRNYRIGLIRTLVHFVNRDSEGLARDFLSLGFLPESADLELIAQDLRKSFGEETSKAQLDFQGIMHQLYAVMYKFKFQLPPEYGMVIRALGSLEGTATTLDPDFRVVASAYPFVVGRLLSDPDPEMRQILRELLIRNDQTIRWNRLERLVIAIAEQSAPSDKSSQRKVGPTNDQHRSKGKALSGMRSTSFDTRAVAAATADLLSFILSDKGLRVRLSLTKDMNSACDMLIYSLFYKILEAELPTSTDMWSALETPRDKTNYKVHYSDKAPKKPYDDEYQDHSEELQSSMRTLKDPNFTVLSANQYQLSKVFGWMFRGPLGGTGNKGGSRKGVETDDDKDRKETDANVDANPTKEMDDEGHQKVASADESRIVDLESRLQTALYAFVKAIEAAPEVWIPLLVAYMAHPEARCLFTNVACAGGHSFCRHLSEATFLSLSKSLHDSRL